MRKHPLWRQIKQAYSEHQAIWIRTDDNYFGNARIHKLTKRSVDISYSWNNDDIYITRSASIVLDAIISIESEVGIFDKSLEPLVVIRTERERPLF